MADTALALALPIGAPALKVPGKPTATTQTGAAATDATTEAADPFAKLMAAANPAAANPLAMFLGVAKPATADSDTSPSTDLAVSEKPQDSSDAKNADDSTTDPTALLSLLMTPAPTPQMIIPVVVQASAPAPQVQLDTPTTTTAPASVARLAMLSPNAAKPALPVATDQAAQQQAAAPVAPPAPATLTSVSALVAMMTAQDTAPAAAPAQVTAPSTSPANANVDFAQIQQAQAQPAPPQFAAAIAAATQVGTAAPVTPDNAAAAAIIAAQADATVPVAPGNAAAPVIAAQAEATIPQVIATPTPAVARNIRTVAPKIAQANMIAPQQRTEGSKAPTTPTRAQDRASQTRPTIDHADTTSIAAAVQQPQADTTPIARADATTKVSDAGSIEAMTDRHLDLAKGNQWLDGLTRDIVATGGNNANLSFTLSPEHLGTLKVDILKGDDGATVNLTTDTDRARNIIQDAQPRLVAEARAQGLTLKETNVSTNSDQSSSQRQPAQSQASAQHSASQQQMGQDRRAFAQTATPAPRRQTLSTASGDSSERDLYA